MESSSTNVHIVYKDLPRAFFKSLLFTGLVAKIELFVWEKFLGENNCNNNFQKNWLQIRFHPFFFFFFLETG